MKLLLRLLLLLFAGVASATGEPLPRFEMGIGLLTLAAPDYRGSENRSEYLLPTPYIKFRGNFLRIDEGASGVLFESDDALLTLSGNLTLPTSSDTREREGMSDLQALVELGPSANFRLGRHGRGDWWLDLPLRFAFAIEDLDSIGQVFQPRLSWRKPARRLGEWKLRFNTGPLYSDGGHHDYFYSVAPAEATATRPAYRAEGGASGLRTEFTWSRRIERYWLGGFLRYDDLSTAVIDDSPLVSTSRSWMAGVALAWVFHEE